MTKSFTLIEVIIVIVIIGIFSAGLATMAQEVLYHSAKPEIVTTAVSLAGGEAERIIGLSFSGVVNATLTAYGGNFSAYSYEVLVTDSTVYPDCKEVEVRVHHRLINYVSVKFLKGNYSI